MVSMRMFNPRDLMDYQKVLDFYKRVDSDYFPRLSERPEGLEGHMLRIINSGGNFCLFEHDGVLEGAAGFFPLDKNKTVVQFTLFSFSERFRGTLAPYRMIKYLIEKREEFGYMSTRKIVARTWYKESANRLEGLGFKKVSAIEGDIVPQRTSFYFGGEVDFVVRNIMRR